MNTRVRQTVLSSLVLAVLFIAAGARAAEKVWQNVSLSDQIKEHAGISSQMLKDLPAATRSEKRTVWTMIGDTLSSVWEWGKANPVPAILIALVAAGIIADCASCSAMTRRMTGRKSWWA